MNDQAELLEAQAAFKPRARGAVIGAAALGLVLGAVIGAGAMSAFAGGPAKRSKAPVAQAPSASAAAPASAAPAAAPPKNDFLERVSAGDRDAVKALEARPQEARTAEEATALAHARAAAKRAELTDMKRKITLVPKILDEDKATLGRLKELANDREVATDALSMLVTLPGTDGTDLLFSLYRDMKAGSENAELVEDLLYSKDVRPKLSPGLAALLELRKVEKCEDARETLKRVKEVGDRRVLPSMMRFYNKRGCGEKKLDDCWRCLRSPDLLKEVTTQVAKHATR